MRKDGCSGRAVKQENSTLSNPDCQSGRIYSKWHWFWKGDKSTKPFPSNYHRCKACFWKRFLFTQSRIQPLFWNVKGGVFSLSRNILPSPEIRKSCYTTLRRWVSVWPLGSRNNRSHISQRYLKAKLVAWNPVEWPDRAACVCFPAWPSGARSLNKFWDFKWPWYSASLILCHFSQAVKIIIYAIENCNFSPLWLFPIM